MTGALCSALQFQLKNCHEQMKTTVVIIYAGSRATIVKMGLV